MALERLGVDKKVLVRLQKEIENKVPEKIFN